MKTITLGLSVAALAIAGTAAYAQNTQHAQHAQHTQHTMRGDADGNGVVTRAEAQTRAAAMFARMDANSDGRIDQADREARMGRMFDRMDADKNGQVSRAEFTNAHQSMHAMRGSADAPHEGRRGGHRGGHGGMMRMMAARADANKDGAISQAEFTAAAMQRFDRVDTSKDGQITAEERQAARAQMRAAMHKARAE